MQRLIDAGKSPEEAVELVAGAAMEAFDGTAPMLVRRLVDTAPRMLRERGRSNRAFERRLRRDWGRALDLYYMILVGNEEVGEGFNGVNRPAAVERQDHLFEALVGLHARACRTAAEVHHLLCGGFPMGALARCRTLHELAVTAIILADYGSRDEHNDLAERYLLHEVVHAFGDAETYQKNYEAMGHEPFTDEDMATLTEQRDALVDRFGKSFTSLYGWAANLVGKTRPEFRHLERLAEVSHLRSYFRWASHEVHADSKGLALNVVERGGVAYMVAGRTNAGLAEPGHMALISLHQVTVSMLLSPEMPAMLDVQALQAMRLLVERAGEAFDLAEESIAAAEERFQARQAARSRRWWQRRVPTL